LSAPEMAYGSYPLIERALGRSRSASIVIKVYPCGKLPQGRLDRCKLPHRAASLCKVEIAVARRWNRLTRPAGEFSRRYGLLTRLARDVAEPRSQDVIQK
jgi:hypothetical protein